MPEADVKAVLPTVSNVQQILHKKHRWGVAATNLAYRLHKLGCISDWAYQRLAIRLTELGYRSDEPGGRPSEKSLFWQKVFDGMRVKKMNKHTVADALSVPVTEIENLVFRLANMTTFDGGAMTAGKSRAVLRVVKN